MKSQRATAQWKDYRCFYVESPAMRMLLTKLRVDTYLGLVAASSIIRPGVSNSGMMREYILRFTDLLSVRCPSGHIRNHARYFWCNGLPGRCHQSSTLFCWTDAGQKQMFYAVACPENSRSRDEFKRVENQYFENCKERGIPMNWPEKFGVKLEFCRLCICQGTQCFLRCIEVIKVCTRSTLSSRIYGCDYQQLWWLL